MSKEETVSTENGIRTIYFMGVKTFDTKENTKHQHIVITDPMKILQKTFTEGISDFQKISRQCRDKRKVTSVFNYHKISVTFSGGIAPRISI
jgi:hypothetical protein